LSVCLLIIACLLYKALTNFKVSKPIALLLALFVMVFVAVCHFSTSYRLSSTISIMGWLLLLWGV
jgi:hypothetical protein